VRIRAHLCFDGQCEAAFRAYQRLLGGEIVTLLKYGETAMADAVDAATRDRILHATLKIGDDELLGADVAAGDYRVPQGFYVLLSFEDVAQSKRVFDALADGGTVHMPFQKMFWSPGFGVLTDRFGTPWEVDTA